MGVTLAAVLAVASLGAGVTPAVAEPIDVQRAVGERIEREPAAPTEVRGRVVDGSGAVVSGADVFVLETLEGTTTGADGSFRLRTDHRGPATLVVQGLGYREGRVVLDLPRDELVEVVVGVAAVELEPIRVEAGSFAMGAGESEPLTALDVVTTPGAHADVLQAVGSLPGVQPVAEGAALYVRGGDVSETKVVLDGAEVLAPYRFESGLVSFGTFDPFDLEGISFSSGGFGARHGDALAGLVELRTAGVPTRREVAVTASLAALAGRASLPIGETAGVWGAVNRSSTELMFRVNGHETDFERVPESRTAGGSASWAYRRGALLKVYAYDEWNRFAVRVDEPSYAGSFTGEDGSRLAVVSVEDVAGPVGIRGSLSTSRRERQQSFGAFLLDEESRLAQGRLELSTQLAASVVGRAGLEGERHVAGIRGSYPTDAEDVRPGTRTTLFDSELNGTRWAGFGEVEWRPAERLEVTTGVRRDASSLTEEATVDPRLSAVLRVADGAFLTGAWGLYHQVPDPLAYEPTVGDPALPPMRSEHALAGLVVEGERGMLRLEAYRKRSSELAQEDREYTVVGGGEGVASGVDVFVRGQGPVGLEGRASYSFIDAERTDPNTGILARSPYEIRHALELVVERLIGSRIRLGGTFRWATGRPYTPVVGASLDEEAGVWRPEYGSPMSERLPHYARVDLTGQLLHSFGGDDIAVLFVSVTNLLDRENVAVPRYSADYSEMEPVTSAFSRTFYFGVSTTIPF